jgi:hypothetical protein
MRRRDGALGDEEDPAERDRRRAYQGQQATPRAPGEGEQERRQQGQRDDPDGKTLPARLAPQQPQAARSGRGHRDGEEALQPDHPRPGAR